MILPLYYSNYYLYGMTDSILIFAMLVVMVIGMIASARVSSVFRQYNSHDSGNGMTAAEVASAILRRNGSNVSVVQIPGDLTDNFNPRKGVVSLSQSVYPSGSVAAMAVAVHEVGHVMQYQEGYLPIRIRNAILPVASFGSRFSYLFVILGLFMGEMGYTISLIGIGLFVFALLFQLITLPVEINASRRALDMLVEGGYIAGAEQEQGARKVLRAAAFTYVVAALSSLVSLLRLIAIANRNRRR